MVYDDSTPIDVDRREMFHSNTEKSQLISKISCLDLETEVFLLNTRVIDTV